VLNRSSLTLQESSLRVTTVAFNLIARYPGQFFQPYAGIGAGAFYFSSSNGSIQGRQFRPGLNLLAGAKVLVTDEWGLFAEGKYNLANVSDFDPTFGLSGMYSIFHLVAGVSYHF
jgi:opacity protein-like surface antigen